MAFRKSKKLFGIFRVTASTNGLSVSAGVPGARVSLNSKGDVRRTVSVPGSGWYDTKKIGNIKPTPPPLPVQGVRNFTNGQAFDLAKQEFWKVESMVVFVTADEFQLRDNDQDTEPTRIPKNMIGRLRRSGNVVNVTLHGEQKDGSGLGEQTLPFVCLSVEQAITLRAALAP